MIVAADYDELVFTCQEILAKDATRIVGELVNTINSNASYAALTIMALYAAATVIDFSLIEVDNIIRIAESKCADSKVTECRRFFVKFKEFESAKDKIHLSNGNFFMPSSNLMQ